MNLRILISKIIKKLAAMSSEKAFQVLNLPFGNTDNLVKNFKELALKYHPDRPGGDLEKMKEINEARDTVLKYQSKDYKEQGFDDASKYYDDQYKEWTNKTKWTEEELNNWQKKWEKEREEINKKYKKKTLKRNLRAGPKAHIQPIKDILKDVGVKSVRKEGGWGFYNIKGAYEGQNFSGVISYYTNFVTRGVEVFKIEFKYEKNEYNDSWPEEEKRIEWAKKITKEAESKFKDPWKVLPESAYTPLKGSGDWGFIISRKLSPEAKQFFEEHKVKINDLKKYLDED